MLLFCLKSDLMNADSQNDRLWNGRWRCFTAGG